MIKSVLAAIGLLAIVGGVGAVGYFFGGFFNVAADNSGPALVNWALVEVRKASIARRATDKPPASLLDPAMVQRGALAYSESGCVYCHGEPGVESAKFSEGLDPPPDLRKIVTERRPEDLFWVIKNGIKMSGMPSFGSDRPPESDQNIWAIVAFLKKLSIVSDENFRWWHQTPLGENWVVGCEPGHASGCGPARD